jgi:hypothetical protein
MIALRMDKLFWSALGAALTMVGANLVSTSRVAAWLLMAGGGLMVLAVLGRWWLIRAATRRVVRWLGERADYGAVHIQNANLQNAKLPVIDPVNGLTERFNAWERMVDDGADSCLQDSDARRLKMLDTYTPRGLRGVTVTHATIGEWTAEKVSRLRNTADRLQRGEIQLKRYRR